MKRIIHWYKAYKFFRRMKKGHPLILKNPELIANELLKPGAVIKIENKKHKFGWSYFNKYRGWNWLLGVDK